MKAVVFTAYGDTEVLRYQDMAPPTIRKKELLIKVRYAGVNPKDCFIRRGKFKLFTGWRFPQLLGADLSGEVSDVGPAVRDLQPGEAVYGMLNGWRSGAYAEYVAVKPGEIAPKPANLSFAEAAAVPLAALTALQALRDLGKIGAGNAVCINGASGGVGTFALQIARAFDARITAVSSFRNLRLCQKLGADRTIDYTQEDVLALKERFDVFFDVFGNFSFPRVRPLLSPRGIYITTVPRPGNFIQVLLRSWRSGKKAKMVMVKSRTADLNRLTELIEGGVVKPVIDREYPLRQATGAHAYLQTRRARGKVILKVG